MYFPQNFASSQTGSDRHQTKTDLISGFTPLYTHPFSSLRFVLPWYQEPCSPCNCPALEREVTAAKFKRVDIGDYSIPLPLLPLVGALYRREPCCKDKVLLTIEFFGKIWIFPTPILCKGGVKIN